MHKTAAAALVGTLVAGTVAVAVAPAQADIERHVTCTGGERLELNVDREGAGFEVDADLDSTRPGDRWRIKVRHNGVLVSKVVRTTDYEGEVDHGVYRADAAGRDAFKVKARNLDTGSVCKARLVTG